MSNKRKLTDWFAPNPAINQSSKGAIADSKPRISPSRLGSKHEGHRADSRPPGPRSGPSVSDKMPKAGRMVHNSIPRVSQVIDLADSGIETDSSVEIVGANSGGIISKNGKSPIVVEVSSDAMTPSTVSPKSAMGVSDDNSDIVSSLKRPNATASTTMSKRRVSETPPALGSEPGRASPNERARRHVEVTLTMRPSPKPAPSPRKEEKDNHDMEWTPLPLTPPNAASNSKETRFKSLASDRDRSQDTCVASTESQRATAAEIIARMKADVSAKTGAISSDDESKDNRTDIAAVLAEDTSDNDEDEVNVLFGQKMSSVGTQASKRHLFSTSSLSPAPDDDSDDSQSGYPALRRSSRVVAPPKPITTFVPAASRSRRKQTEFDRLFLEDTRRKRARGGVDGYKQAESLAAALEFSSSANEADDSNDDQDAWSTTESARRSGQLKGARSQSSGASSFMSGSDDNGPEAKAHAGGDERHVGGLAQKYLGHDDTKKLNSILQDDASSLRSRILEDGAQTLGEKRALWEKATISTYATSVKHLNAGDVLVKRLLAAIQNEAVFEATMYLQRWETYQNRCDPTTVRQFVDISLQLAIYSANALLGDNVTSGLVRLLEKYSDNLGVVGLTVRDLIIAACASLGARRDVLQAFSFAKANPLGVGERMNTYNVVVRGKAHRASCSARYIRLMLSLASLGILAPDELSDVIVFMVLIACDPSSPPELERRITNNLQEIYDDNVEADTERRVCNALVDSFKDGTWSQKHLAVSLLPNHTASSRRLQAWVAFGFLVPNELCKVTAQRYLHPPTLVPILTQLLDRGLTTTEQDVLFDLRESAAPLRVPDFEQITIQTHILDIMLTDVRTFVEYEHEVEKARTKDTDTVPQAVPMPIAGKKRTVLDMLVNGLQLMHDGIADGRAAHLDRSRLKQVLQCLQVRLTYEKHSALEFVAHKEGAPMRMSLDAHFSRMHSSISPLGPSI